MLTLAAVASIVHREDLWQLCRDELTGVDARTGGWDIRGRWFGVVVGATPQTGKLPRGETIPRHYYGKAIELGDPFYSSQAHLALGLLAGENGDIVEAKTHFEAVAQSPVPKMASLGFSVLDMIHRGNFPPEIPE